MDNKQIAVLDESTIKDLVYEIRGVKVMLDFDLAKIYGYTTKAFNQQINRNLERFPEGFRFQITHEEMTFLRSQNVTIKEGDMRGRHPKYLPYAFTEQGIYMVMTVLKGELAVKQSITLVILFKAMRDHIAMEDPDAFAALSREVGSHAERIGVLEADVSELMSLVGNAASQNEFLIMDGERIEAGLAFRSIYSKALVSIVCVDDYIGPKTLHFLKACSPGARITLLSDNVGKNPLGQSDLSDFVADTGNLISLKPTKNRVHDRYIILDYGLPSETIFHCGASSKDAGNRMTTIMKIENPQYYHPMFDALL